MKILIPVLTCPAFYLPGKDPQGRPEHVCITAVRELFDGVSGEGLTMPSWEQLSKFGSPSDESFSGSEGGAAEGEMTDSLVAVY